MRYFGMVLGARHTAALLTPTSTTNMTSLQSWSPPPSMSSKPMMTYWLLSGKNATMCWNLSELLLLPLYQVSAGLPAVLRLA